MNVAELIERLRTFPQDATVVIEDADTGWLLALDGATDHLDPQLKVVVALSGDYEEVHSKEWIP